MTTPIENISNLLKARNTLLWIVTREETRVERAIITASASVGYPTRLWDCATGLTSETGKAIDDSLQDPAAMLREIRNNETRAVYVLRDLHKWLDPVVLRSVRSLARKLTAEPKNSARTIIVLTPSSEIPAELAGHATLINYPLPDRKEMGAILDDVLSRLSPEVRANAMPEDSRDAAIDAVVGLSAEEASNCYAKSLVTAKRIDVSLVATEKKTVIDREKVLTWHDPDPRGFDAVGGLDQLKSWANHCRATFSPEARAYGLEPAKGMLGVGISGCGKSYFVKALASHFGQPLLRLDMGALKSKWVGESEANIRKALQVAEMVAPAILWIDEIEKGMAGASGAQGDGGVSTDALGAILTWMQEKKAPVFVIATANDVRSLPPELMRRGRFDDVFWFDLPTASERVSILDISIRAGKQDSSAIDLERLSSACMGFSGAECASIVEAAKRIAFLDGARPITTRDLESVAQTVIPLAKTAAEKLQTLRDWAKGRARPASTPDTQASDRLGALDIEGTN